MQGSLLFTGVAFWLVNVEASYYMVMSETWGWVMKILESLPLFFRQI